MESIGSDGKPEKQTTALSSYFLFNVVSTTFRLLKLRLALFFLLRISTHVLFAVPLSCECSFLLLDFVAHLLFVFALCNAIIITLLAKLGRSFARGLADGGAVEELYEEIVKISESRARPVLPPSREAEEVVYEDKAIISEVGTTARARGREAGSATVDLEEGVAASADKDKEDDEDEEYCRDGLRPPEVEKRPKAARSCGGGGDEEMSNEEFQGAIEAFIAKQLRFRREETLAIVLPQPR